MSQLLVERLSRKNDVAIATLESKRSNNLDLVEFHCLQSSVLFFAILKYSTMFRSVIPDFIICKVLAYPKALNWNISSKSSLNLVQVGGNNATMNSGD